MATLAREQRRELERTVKQARRVAEDGAHKAIDRLGVGDATSPTGLSRAGQSLRERLRAHGRQLGDRRDTRRGTQITARLVAECAYEHWHRMLFARFLAENDLLIEPTHGVAITLDECKELAREQSEDWLTLASSYAVRMLPQIFRPGDPVLDVSLPPETWSELEDLLKNVPQEVFKADDSLGWVYQFWQGEHKEEVDSFLRSGGALEPTRFRRRRSYSLRTIWYFSCCTTRSARGGPARFWPIDQNWRKRVAKKNCVQPVPWAT
jgi:hypothetical protein